MRFLAALLLLCAVEAHADTIEARVFPQDTTVTVGSTFWVRVSFVNAPARGWAGFDWQMAWTNFGTSAQTVIPTLAMEPLCTLAGFCPDSYGTSTCNHDAPVSARLSSPLLVDGFQNSLCHDAQYHYPALRDGPVYRLQFTALRAGSGVIAINSEGSNIYPADNDIYNKPTLVSPFGDWAFVTVVEPPPSCGWCCTHYCDEGLVSARKASWSHVKAIYR